MPLPQQMMFDEVGMVANQETEIKTDKIIQFPKINNTEIDETPVRYNLDGSVSKVRPMKKAGISSKVYAFRTQEEIQAMINVFDRKISEAKTNKKIYQAARNKLLFILGINLGLRASDLRTLRWNFFLGYEDGKLVFNDSYSLQPKKTKKQHKFVKLFFNETVKRSIMQFLKQYPYEKISDYCFPSQKSNKKDKDNDGVILENSILGMIKETAREAKIKQNIGSHSLRQTWGFWIWHEATDKEKALVVLQNCFNHSSTQITMRYIGLMDDEIKEAYCSINLGQTDNMDNLKFYH